MDPKSTLSFRPLYLQMKEALTTRMVSGDWTPGTVLPSETALARDYGVSQGTIRKALDAMAAEHLVVRRQGRGTAVARHSCERSLFQFFHIHSEDGTRQLPTSEVLDCVRGAATALESQALGLNPDAAVIRIFRVRRLESTPTMTEWITVSVDRFAGLEQAGRGLPNALYELYQNQYGVTVHKAVERIYAVAADERDGRLLGLTPGHPLLEIRRVALDLQNTPVEWRVSRCRTDHHHYFNELT